MFSALKQFLSPSPVQQQAHEAYAALVAQSRQPFFYQECGVPDTLDGRFDVIVLHMFLAIHRLHGESPEAAEFIRALQEIFFADMDRSLRELGSTDTGTGKRVKKMVQAFYGRMYAYEESITDPTAFREALKRNLYRNGEIENAALESLANYALATAEHLARQSSANLTNGALSFLS